MKRQCKGPELASHPARLIMRVIEAHFLRHRVNRASDLPEEAKVRLYQDIRTVCNTGRARQGLI